MSHGFRNLKILKNTFGRHDPVETRIRLSVIPVADPLNTG